MQPRTLPLACIAEQALFRAILKVDALHVALQDAGKKQVAAILGVQAARAATQPRPFLKLARQHLAVQARLAARLHTQTSRAATLRNTCMCSMPPLEKLCKERRSDPHQCD